jgi:YD repeat-containing protein
MDRSIGAALLMGCGCVVGVAQAAETTTYSYNSLGRLSRVEIAGGPGNSSVVDYQYDLAGNRQHYIVSGSTSSGSITINPFGSTANTTANGVVLGVRISGSPAATGTVTFTENGTFLGSSFVYDGQASVILEGFSLGTHTVTASYSGDSSNAPYSYTFTIKVQNLAWLPAVLEILLSD